MYGQISILEAISTITIILISLSIFLPTFKPESKLGDVLLLVRARDIIITADRLRILDKIAFNQTEFLRFLSTVKPAYIISWVNVDSKIQRFIDVACLCTEEEKEKLISWVTGLKFNNIEVVFNIFKVDSIDLIEKIPSDVLIIWGNKTLGTHKQKIEDYLKSGNGIILVGDPSWEQVRQDPVYSEIFGLAPASTNTVRYAYYNRFRDDMEIPYRPVNASIISYEPWKYFYNIPIPLYANLYLDTIPVEGLSQPSCIQTFKGSLKIHACNISMNIMDVCEALFWICDSTLYFDTNWNKIADRIVNPGENFYIINVNNQTESFTFYLSYIEKNKVGISFKPVYKFHDFIKWGAVYTNQPAGNPPPGSNSFGLRRLSASYTVLAPTGSANRILVQLENTTINGERVPGIILNQIKNARTAWVANFTEEGVGDDERMLLISLLLWASKKKMDISSFVGKYSLGYETSYINVMNSDIFEPYIFTLGLGYPK